MIHLLKKSLDLISKSVTELSITLVNRNSFPGILYSLYFFNDYFLIKKTPQLLAGLVYSDFGYLLTDSTTCPVTGIDSFRTKPVCIICM